MTPYPPDDFQGTAWIDGDGELSGRILIGGYVDYEDSGKNIQQHGWCEKFRYVIDKK